MDITVEQLFAKIGMLTLMLEAERQRVAELEAQLKDKPKDK